MPLLKNLMQASALNIRKAYKRSASTLPRIASFIGTSNREDLWWTVPVRAVFSVSVWSTP